jgi:hypothetical protein
MKRLLLPLVLAAVVAALFAAPAVAQNPHFVKTPTCTLSSDGTTVTCTGGKIAGVGTVPTQVGIDVAGGCANKPGHEPRGHVQAVSQPITPKGGNIVFGSLSATADCPPGLSPVFGDVVTYFIVQDGQTTVVGTVPIT